MKSIGRRFFYRKILKTAGASGKSERIGTSNKAVWQKRAIALVMTAALALQLFSLMPDVTATDLPSAENLWKYPEIKLFNDEPGKGIALTDLTESISPFVPLEAYYKFKVSEADLLYGIEVMLPDNLKAIEGVYTFYIVDDLIAGYREATAKVDENGKIIVSIKPLDVLDDEIDDTDLNDDDDDLDEEPQEEPESSDGSDGSDSEGSDVPDGNNGEPGEGKESGDGDEGSDGSEEDNESKESITDSDAGEGSQPVGDSTPSSPVESSSSGSDESKTASRVKRAGMLKADGLTSGAERYYYVEFTIDCEFVFEELPEIPDEGAWIVLVLSAGKFIPVELDTMMMVMEELFMPLSDLSGMFHERVSITGRRLSKGGVAVANNTELWLSDELRLEYDFRITGMQLQAIQKSTNKTFEIQADGLLTSIVGNRIISLTGVPASEANFAVIYSDEGKAWIRFEGNFWAQNEQAIADSVPGMEFVSINSATIFMECKLDPVRFGSATEYDIQLTGSRIRGPILDNKPAPAGIDKLVRYVNGKLQWTITYVPGTPATGQTTIFPVQLRDTLGAGADAHFIDESSIKVVTRRNGESTGGVNTDADITAFLVNTALNPETPTAPVVEILYELVENNPNYRVEDLKLVTLTFESIPDPELIGSGDPLTFTNTGGVKEHGKSELTRTATHRIPATSNTWLNKSGRQLADKAIEWTIVIDSLDQHLSKLVLYDRMGSGLTLRSDSITVNGSPLPASQLTQAPPVIDGTDASWKIDFGLDKVPDKYTVVYVTDVDPAYFENPQDTKTGLDNYAWLTFEWTRYHGPGVNVDTWVFTEPGLDKGFNLDDSIIRKSAVGYSAKTQEITWRVEVNPHKVNIIGGKITDKLPPNNSYVVGSLTPVSGTGTITYNAGASNPWTETSPAGFQGTAVFDVGTLGTGTVVFTIKTKVNELAITNRNANKTYTNEVKFDGEVMVGMTPKTTTDSDTASRNFVSQVLSKRNIGFKKINPGEIEIEWEITVNHNGTTMDGKVVDTLLPGITFVPGSESDSAVTGVPSGNVITFTHDNGFDGDTTTFRYKTVVDVNHPHWSTAFEKTFVTATPNASNVDVQNTAVLKQDGVTDVEVKATQTITNAFLKKTHTRVGESENISYKVEINPYGKDLTAMGRILTDSLGDGLNIDPTSIKLYEVIEPAVSGALAKGTQVIGYSGGAYNGNVSFTQRAGGGFASVSVELPANKKPYILEYICTIDTARPGPFTNSIGFGGGAGSGSIASDSVSNSGGGMGMMGSVARLDLTKIDEVRRNGIAGVGFSVYQTVNGVEYLIMSGTTNASGVAQFFPLRLDTEYTIVEATPAEGYDGPNSLKVGASSAAVTAVKTSNKVIGESTREAFKVTIGERGIQTLTVTNAPTLVSFEFTKFSSRDGVNTPLSGAEFELSDTVTGSTFTAIKATSDADGRVSFSNIPFGEYLMEEKIVPFMHFTSEPIINVTIDANGRVVRFGSQSSASGLTGLEVINNYSEINLIVTSYNTTVSGAKLPGVVFELQRKTAPDVWVREGVLTTGSTGVVEFKHLHNDADYKVIAVSPDGFYDTSSEYEFKTGTSLEVTYYLDWVFHSPIGNISFTKIDDGNGEVLEGIWFDLYYGSGLTKVLIDSQASDVSGLVAFSDLSLDGAFSDVVIGVTTDPGNRPIMDNTYNMVRTEFTIEERWDNRFYPTAPKVLPLTPAETSYPHFDWINFRGVGSITLKVTDAATGLPLSDVEFGLFGPFDDFAEPMITLFSCEEGIIEFTDLLLPFLGPATFREGPVKCYNDKIEYRIMQIERVDGYTSRFLDHYIETILWRDNPDENEVAPLVPARRTGSGTSSGQSDELDDEDVDPSDPSNPDHYRRAALPRTGIESIMTILVIGLMASLLATTVVIIIIRRQSAKDK